MMYSKILSIHIVGIFVIILLRNVCGKIAGTTCIGPDLADGICVPLSKCSVIQNELDKAGTEDATLNEYIQDSNAICNYIKSYICCPLEVEYENGTIFRTLMPESTPKKSETIIHPKNISTASNDLASSKARLLTPEDGCGYTKKPQNRIVGGGEAKIGAWPWMVLTALTYEGAFYMWWCGGTLITTKHVLTAAHCVRDELTFVRLGENDYNNSNPAVIQDIPVTKSFAHANYTVAYDGRYDIGILWLKYAAIFTDTVRPICLPFNDAGHFKKFVGLNVIATGWGMTKENGSGSSVLRAVQVPVVDLSICKKTYPTMDDSVICAGGEKGKSSCFGDSGGPIISGKIINGTEYMYEIGITAGGYHCGVEGTPIIYINVQSFIGWIQDHIKE